MTDKCKCLNSGLRFQGNLAAGEFRHGEHEGRNVFIVPVVMARADVVMKGSVIPVEEFLPETWNGVPVTNGHPEKSPGEFVSANEPKTLEQYRIGRIFNARVEGQALKAEAWLDVELTELAAPGLIDALMNGAQLDVSTGYFSADDEKRGTLNGVEYEIINRAIRPDHLAFLPGGEGACNWDAGCGVRANQKGRKMLTVNEALAALGRAIDAALSTPLKTKERINMTTNKKTKARTAPKAREGEPAPRDEAIAALIAREDTPFGPGDETPLASMSEEAFVDMMKRYEAAPEEPAAMEGEEEPAAMEGEEEPVAQRKGVKGRSAYRGAGGFAVMCAADREALAFARRSFAEHRNGLVSQITANSAIPEKTLKTMDTAALESIAKGLYPAPSFHGRALPSAGETDEEVRGMTSTGVVSHFRKKAA